MNVDGTNLFMHTTSCCVPGQSKIIAYLLYFPGKLIIQCLTAPFLTEKKKKKKIPCLHYAYVFFFLPSFSNSDSLNMEDIYASKLKVWTYILYAWTELEINFKLIQINLLKIQKWSHSEVFKFRYHKRYCLCFLLLY